MNMFLYKSQIIQGGLQAQLGPTGQSAPQPVKEVDETLKLRIHQVLTLSVVCCEYCPCKIITDIF